MSSGNIRLPGIRSLLGAAAIAVVLTACGSGGGSSAPKTGAAAIVVTAPAGVTGNVTVSGPNGYSTSVSTTTLLTGLAVGSYTVTAAPVVGSDPIVGTADTAAVSGSPISVTVGSQDTATVAYGSRAGSGGLWVAQYGPAKTTIEYTAAQIASTTSAAPATAIAMGTSGNFGAAFDPSGNLWVAAFFNNEIMEYTASQLASSGSPTPAAVINTGGGSAPAGLAFDANGNLWVTYGAANTIVEFTPSQLASSGSPSPSITISASSSSLSTPIGLAFDESGNLWAANAGSNTVVEYKQTQLTATGAPTPTVTVTGGTGSISGPLLIAFDASGNLWVANGNTSTPNTVVGFSPSQLATSGTPAPAVVLSASSGSLAQPSAIAFDNSGNMWVSNLIGNSIVEFTPSQLVTSGSPTPNTTVTGSSLSEPFGLAFDAHATNLPIKTARRR